MKTPTPMAIRIRYFGPDHHRMYCLQRANGQFWTGIGWNKILDCAKIYRRQRDAGRDCARLQNKQYRGLPLRTFKVELRVALVGEDVELIGEDALSEYLAEAAVVTLENSVHGDGPVEGSFVRAKMLLATLEEIEPPRKRF